MPLEEYIKVGPVIMRPDLTPVRTLPVKADREGQDTEYLVELCDEVSEAQGLCVRRLHNGCDPSYGQDRSVASTGVHPSVDLGLGLALWQ